MKLLIQHGNSESEYSDKDLKREADRIARKLSGKLESYAIICTSSGAPRLKVIVKQRVPGRAHEFTTETTEYIAL